LQPEKYFLKKKLVSYLSDIAFAAHSIVNTSKLQSFLVCRDVL